MHRQQGMCWSAQIETLCRILMLLRTLTVNASIYSATLGVYSSGKSAARADRVARPFAAASPLFTDPRSFARVTEQWLTRHGESYRHDWDVGLPGALSGQPTA